MRIVVLVGGVDNGDESLLNSIFAHLASHTKAFSLYVGLSGHSSFGEKFVDKAG